MKSTRGKNDSNLTREGVREATPEYRSVNVASEHFSPSLVRPPMFAGQSSNKPLPSIPTKGSNWCIREAKPKPIFPLERAEEISDAPQFVSLRIGDSLRLRSVNAEFKGCQAICTTSCYLTYSIDLYAGSDGGTIVEVMRRSGCGFAFRKEREAIFNAARGFGGDAPSKLPTILKIPESMLKDYRPPTQQDHEDTLDRAIDQLHSTKRDVQLFTLQNLSSITTPDKVHRASAELMSTLVMKSYGDVRDMISDVLISCAPESDHTSQKILNSCLTIFANSMTSLSAKPLELEAILQESKRFTETMVQSLIGIVKDCRCPHNTFLALRCLCLFLKNSSIAREKMSEEALSVVKSAESFGKQRHLKLQNEARSALEALDCH